MKLFIIFLFTVITVNAGEWYEGGTLHSSLIKDWKKATKENRIATSADMIASVKDNLNFKIKSYDSLKNNSIDLMTCIDVATKDKVSDTQKVPGIAILCMNQMGWFKK